MAEEYYNSKEVRKDEDFAKVQDWLYYCLSKWYWFVIALAITFAIAVFYILKTQPTYTRVASILIKEDNNSSLSNEFSSFSDFGVTKNNTNLYNEMITLKSPTYMKQVVKELHLDMNYSIKGPFHEDVLYDKTLPINVTMADVQEDDAATLTVTLKKDNEVILSDFVLDKEEIEHAPISAKLNTLVSTPIGKVTVTPTQYFEGIYDDPIKVRHIGTEAATGKYVGRLEIELNNDKASVVDLKLEDESTKRAEDILNMLYEIYNKNWVKDINEQAESTSKFIDKELLTIQGELGDVDENISNYKSEHYVPDIQLASNINMHKVEQTNSLILDLKNQLFMANYIKKQLGNSGDFKVLPANSGIDNSSVAEQIKMYNQNVMRRNNLVANSNENNPLVADLDESLTATRQAIHASIDNTIATLNARIADLQGSKAETRQQIASNPNQEKYLLSVERQQKVKEQLYLFLLQKREENELSKAYTAYNTKMLNPPAGTNSPTKPVKMNVMIVAFALGLLLPMLVLFVLYNMDTKVHSRRDLDSLSLPFVGEIPLSYRKRKGIMSLFNKKKEVREIVVQEKAHNSINEAFRVVRTNLEFISGKDEGTKKIMFTSANPGSGKTFISMNLATSFAIKGKRVLIIDLDMRKASLSTFINSPEIGISDYLSERINDFDSIIMPSKVNDNLDVIPVGTIPPNPTELLFNERLEKSIDAVSDRYDYIFIDCPPLEIVADASIVNKLCDMTVFVIRAELFDRSRLHDVEKYYTENRYKNMTLLLNGTVNPENGGYGYRRYGYGYGYNYEYTGK